MRLNFMWKTIVGIFLILAAAAVARPQTAQVVAVRAGRLFDSKTGQELTRQVGLVQGERISDVRPEDQVKIPAGALVLDLSQATVLPGLIDGHTQIYNSLNPVATLKKTFRWRSRARG